MNLSIEIIITPEFYRWYPKFYSDIFFYLSETVEKVVKPKHFSQYLQVKRYVALHRIYWINWNASKYGLFRQSFTIISSVTLIPLSPCYFFTSP